MLGILIAETGSLAHEPPYVRYVYGRLAIIELPA